MKPFKECPNSLHQIDPDEPVGQTRRPRGIGPGPCPAHAKTNAVRLLDQAGIPYELTAYEVDESDMSAVHLAAVLDLDPACIFKTLVLMGDKSGYFVCLAPGDDELDLKKAARASGNKNAALIPVKELLPLTGYVRGGCSPIGMKKPFPTYIHETAELFDHIYISAGKRGLQIKLAPADLIGAVGMAVADLTVN